MLLRTKVSKILIEWSMPIRQVAIGEIIEAVREDTIREFEKENKCYWGSYDRALEIISKKDKRK